MLNEGRRNYTMSDSDLCMFTSNLVLTMTRDQTEFTAHGITAEMVTAMETLGNAFEVFMPDSFYQADVSLAVETKNNTRAALTVKVRDVADISIIKWGEGSAQYRKFGAGKITTASDREFLSICRQVVATATGFLSDLTASGLTQDMIDAVEDDAQTFEDNLNSISEAVLIRDTKKGERIAKGNELYSYVSKYCTIGKIIWDDVDETKYNDYVIYPTEHPSLSKPQNLTAALVTEPNVSIDLNWDAVTDATSYDVYVSIRDLGAPSGTFNLLNNFTTNSANVPVINNKRNYFKLKAKNETDKSPYSDEAFVDVEIES